MALLGSILVLLAIVIIHEAGHFVVAILAGIRVKSLHLGVPIGPQLKLHLGKYPFTISLVLIGAMVDVDENQLWEAPLPKRIAVFLGGPLANFASLFVVAILLNGIGGGLSYGWEIISLSLISPFLIIFGYISPNEIMGPVGIVSLSTQILSLGLGFRAPLHLFAVISGALGAFNLFPIPALDGGRVVLSILAEFGLPKKWFNILIYGSLLALLILMVVITVKDVALFT